MLTIGDIRASVAAIKKAADESDFDAAHSIEKALYRQVLEFIAKEPLISEDDMRAFAAAALESQKIQFRRETA